MGDELEVKDDDAVVDIDDSDDSVGDGPVDGETPSVEPWQETETEQEGVPLSAHIKTKHKLKGRISEQTDEITKLKAKIEALEKPAPAAGSLKRPQSEDFESDDEYRVALEQYDDAATAARFDRLEAQKKQSDAKKALTDAVDSHYERANKLVEEHGIDPEIFKHADATVRQGMDAVMPGQGDGIVDKLISILGEGSDKVFFHQGRNKAALGEMQRLIAEDPSGLKLAAYLGSEKRRLTNPIKRTSKAPAPAAQANGDAPASNKGGAAQRKYAEAHKKGDTQVAYNIKKDARAAGVDVSGW